MAIVQIVNENTFIREFDEMNRSDNFTTEARRELFNYYDELSDGIGQPFELDVIAICCDWSECTERELIQEYDYLIDVSDYSDNDELLDAILEELEDNTTVIIVDHYNSEDTYLIQVF